MGDNYSLVVLMSLFPIREISTYTGRNWTIKARVTLKSQMRTFSNDRGSGKVFSVDLLDKDGGEIKASFFNGSADKFYNTVEAGKVYTFTKGNVKVANKRYSTSKHNYEINFDADAVIELSMDDDSAIESVKYNFSTIRDIQTKHLPCTIDLVGVVKDFKPIGKIQPKNGGEELTRRSITLVDKSECAVDVTLWQDSASKIDESILGTKPIVAIKGLSVKEYNGSRTCGTLQQSMIEVIAPEASTGVAATDSVKELVSWWAAHPNIGDVFNLSANQTLGGTPGAAPGSESRGRQQTLTSIADMREECKRGFFGDKGIYFDIVAKLSFVSTKSKDGDIPIHYAACPGCNRKLSDDSRCFACDKVVSNPKLKYLLRAQFVDHSDQCYLSVFDAQAAAILKRPVEELLEAGKKNPESVPDELKKSYFDKTYHLRVRATSQEFKGEMRPRVTVVAADPVDDCVSLANRLLKKIIEKVGVEAAKPMDVIPEAEDKENTEVTAENNKGMSDEDEMPELKKMRMTEGGMDIEPTPIESKE
jgi:replication factor A1